MMDLAGFAPRAYDPTVTIDGLNGVDCSIYPTDDPSSSGFTGLTNYATSVDADAVPEPGALPRFATGLGALGLLGWRGKRKAAKGA